MVHVRHACDGVAIVWESDCITSHVPEASSELRWHLIADDNRERESLCMIGPMRSEYDGIGGCMSCCSDGPSVS